MAEPILKIQRLNKAFGYTCANVNIDLELYPGEVRALAGENGSGKSTLLSQIAGIYEPDGGEMWVNGQPYHPHDAIDANRHKIAMIVQELGVLGNLPASINVFLGHMGPYKKFGMVSYRKMYKAIEETCRKWGLDSIPMKRLCDGMSVEERKMIELVRALSIDPDILILDEVTQALSHNNRLKLYHVIERCKAMGKAVLLISHDLEEVMEIADTVSILRDGVMVATKRVDEITLDELKVTMVGRELKGTYYRDDEEPSYQDEVVLEVTNLEVEDCFSPLSFQVHAGEILGFCGLSDSGIHNIGKALYGLEPHKQGEVRMACENVAIKAPTVAMKTKMAYLPKERDGEGLMMHASILDNAVLPSLKEKEGTLGFLSPEKLHQVSWDAVKEFGVKCVDIHQTIGGLSGGNKQKVNLGRWLVKDLRLLILDCPTRGVDVGVKAYIYSIMRNAKEKGLATVLISDELMEILGMSDRVFVVKQGKIVKELMRGTDFSEEAVIEVMV